MSYLTLNNLKNIKKISNHSLLLHKIKTSFTKDEELIFIQSFYLYLNYHPKNDFVVDFNDIFEWLGFTRKDNAKTLLKNKFVENTDYKVEKTAPVEAGAVFNKQNGGQNKEKILLNVNTFKEFCMYANTEKSKKIRQYYIKLEEILFECIQEEIKYSKLQEREKVLIELNKNKNGVYLGFIEDNLYKFGETSNIQNRVNEHKRTYNQFYLTSFIESNKHKELEQEFKNNLEIARHRIYKEYNNSIKTELLELTEQFTLEKCTDILKQLNNALEYKYKNNETFVLLEQEKTKQLEITKQLELEKEKTKRLEIELELKKLELNNQNNIHTINEEVNAAKIQNKQIVNDKSFHRWLDNNIEETYELTGIKPYLIYKKFTNADFSKYNTKIMNAYKVSFCKWIKKHQEQKQQFLNTPLDVVSINNNGINEKVFKYTKWKNVFDSNEFYNWLNNNICYQNNSNNIEFKDLVDLYNQEYSIEFINKYNPKIKEYKNTFLKFINDKKWNDVKIIEVRYNEDNIRKRKDIIENINWN